MIVELFSNDLYPITVSIDKGIITPKSKQKTGGLFTSTLDIRNLLIGTYQNVQQKNIIQVKKLNANI